MIDRAHALPIARQAELVGISRGTVYYHPEPISDADLALMRRIDELHHRVSITMDAAFCVEAL
jgi:putative transposase